jgi:hypothetical protein
MRMTQREKDRQRFIAWHTFEIALSASFCDYLHFDAALWRYESSNKEAKRLSDLYEEFEKDARYKALLAACLLPAGETTVDDLADARVIAHEILIDLIPQMAPPHVVGKHADLALPIPTAN